MRIDFGNLVYSRNLYLIWLFSIICVVFAGTILNSTSILVVFFLIFIALIPANMVVAALLVHARHMPGYWYALIVLFHSAAIPILLFEIYRKLSKVKPIKLCYNCAENIKDEIRKSKITLTGPGLFEKSQQGTCKNCHKKKAVRQYKLLK